MGLRDILKGLTRQTVVDRLMSTRLGFPAPTPEAALARAQAMAALSPSGFRRPSKADMMKGQKSDRSLRKAMRRAQLREAVRQEQQIEHRRLRGTPAERPLSSFGSL